MSCPSQHPSLRDVNAGRNSFVAGNVRGPKRRKRHHANRALAYQVVGNQQVEVYDLDFASYCLMRDLPIADMVETHPSKNGSASPSRYVFLFQDVDARIDKLSVDYTNSESAKHADCVRRLKKAIRSTRIREG